MSLFEKRYVVKAWNEDEWFLTAKQLCEQVLKDSESDYNWFAPARELVKVCLHPSFPKQYAIPIRIAILNCFANIERRGNLGYDRHMVNLDDQAAIEDCFSYLYDVDFEEAVSARRYYLREIISKASYVRRLFDPLYHPGKTFINLRKQWIDSKVAEYISQKTIDFIHLQAKLRSEFATFVQTADAEGKFDEDERECNEEKKALFTGVINNI